MTGTTTASTTQELAFRATEGLEVALMWHERDNLVSVAVFDAKTGDSFELVLDDSDRPLDVFHHPYAYAARRGVEFDVPSFAVAA